MPGATTARLVVCDFEMPMKLFMMPQTVPNRPTKGAVAPMRGEHAGAAHDAPPVARLDALEARGDPLLDAVLLRGAGGELQLGHRRAEELADLALGVG